MTILRGGCNRCNKSPCICSPTPEDKPTPPEAPSKGPIRIDRRGTGFSETYADGLDDLDPSGFGGMISESNYRRDLHRADIARLSSNLLVVVSSRTGTLPEDSDVERALDVAEKFYRELRERTSS